MAKDVRRRMVEGAVHLLARRGLDATSVPSVLELTGASRGSVYHHFPGGRDELIHEAVRATEGYLCGAIDGLADLPADAVTERFLALWRSLLVGSDFEAGCAVVAVTVATRSPELLDDVATAFRTWRTRLAALLEAGGLPGAKAVPFAAALIASVEGAVIIARAERSLEPFDLVAGRLQDEVGRLLADR